METFLIKALQLIMSLSILVVVHEFGHFLFARINKVRVEKFYLFFNPWFSLFKFKPKNSDTEYGIGWLPLGGYVKIAGMMDESMDKEQMAKPAQPYEFRSKSAGARLMIMIGGVLFNFLLAIIIYSMIVFTWGDTYLPLKNMKLGMEFNEVAHQAGFKDGDIILSADGKDLVEYNPHLILEAKSVTVLRDGVETSIAMPADFMKELIKSNTVFASPRFPMVVAEVMSGPNAKSGLMPGDSIVGVNGMKTLSQSEVTAALKENKGKQVELAVYRSGVETMVPVQVDSTAKIGIMLKTISDIYPGVVKHYGFFESFPKGIEKGVNTLSGYVSQMKYVFTKEGAQNLGGFGTLGKLFPTTWSWLGFWHITAFLSIVLAFMNILPIPALDGGHVMFLLYEVITRRQPNEKFMEYAQMAGMILLFGLLLFANGNDLFRFFFK